MKTEPTAPPPAKPGTTRTRPRAELRSQPPRSQPGRSQDCPPLLRQLGRQVRQLRTARGWTIRELAEACDLSDRFVSSVETGHGNPSILNLAQIAQALGLPVHELLERSEAMIERKVIALLGLRGAGKSTIGARLAHRLGIPFLELDALIEETAGMPIAGIFALYGEEYYRKLELETLRRFVASNPAAVLATGGGIVTSPDTFALLERTCRLVWLKAAPQDHFERVLRQGDERPMENNPHAMAELRALLKAREPLYARAQHAVDTSSLGVEGSVGVLAEALE